jgi:hypothetical protein
LSIIAPGFGAIECRTFARTENDRPSAEKALMIVHSGTKEVLEKSSRNPREVLEKVADPMAQVQEERTD